MSFKKSLLFISLVVLGIGCAKQPEMQSTKTLKDFGIRASNLFFYYRDLDRATSFYTETLGMQVVADYGMAKILRVATTSYLILVDEAEGMHSADRGHCSDHRSVRRMAHLSESFGCGDEAYL